MAKPKSLRHFSKKILGQAPEKYIKSKTSGSKNLLIVKIRNIIA